MRAFAALSVELLFPGSSRKRAELLFVASSRKRADRGLLKGRFTYHGELDRFGKYEFLRSLDVFSTPTVWAEAKGLPAIEALAVGVAVALPEHGAFPELAAATGGGVLHAPSDAAALAHALERLLDDPAARRRHGESGAAAVRERFHADAMAAATLAVYERLLTAGANT